jgi:predicted transcriptional regulator
MATRATSLKLPAELKDRVDRLANSVGETPHALMVRAIEAQVQALELHEAFIADSIAADKEMEKTGVAYALEDVAAYLRARVAGKKVKLPKPTAWRK